MPGLISCLSAGDVAYGKGTFIQVRGAGEVIDVCCQPQKMVVQSEAG